MSLVPRLFRRAPADGPRARTLDSRTDSGASSVTSGGTSGGTGNDARDDGALGTTADLDATTRSLPLVSTPLAARATLCPGDPGRAQIVVLDGTAVPGVAHYRSWQSELARHGFSGIRTGALAPRQTLQAQLAGLHCAQELVLLQLDAPLPRRGRTGSVRPAPPGTRLHRLVGDGYLTAAVIDRIGFGDRWHLDAAMLADICRATPRSRARLAVTDGAVSGFLISGRAAGTGYIQRLAVDDDVRRRGVATALIDDALAWMRRHGVQQVFVNTHTDNTAALALYHRLGFHDLDEPLRVFEGDTLP